MEAMQIRTQGIRQDQRIAAIILGASRRITIPKAIELFGIDREHREPVLHQRLHHGPPGNLDGYSNGARRLTGLGA